MSSFLTKYQIIKKISKGSYGTVFRIRRINDNVEFACKVQPFGNLSELDILTRFNHKHILHLEEFYIFSQLVQLDIIEPSLVMILPLAKEDLIGSLSDPEYNRLINNSEIAKARLIYEISSAVLFLVQNRILHLDLKPGNILLFPDYTIKIADFGIICYEIDKYSCDWDHAVFSYLYRPPEEFINVTIESNKIIINNTNQKVGRRIVTDQTVIWSLGLIFYEILTGISFLTLLPRLPPLHLIEYEVISMLMNNIFITRDKFLSKINDGDARNLISSILKSNREERIHVIDIFSHPYMRKFQYTDPVIGKTLETSLQSISQPIQYNNDLSLYDMLAITKFINERNKLNTENLYLSVDLYYKCKNTFETPYPSDTIYFACILISDLLFYTSHKYNKQIYRLFNTTDEDIIRIVSRIIVNLRGIIYPINYYTIAFSKKSLLLTLSYILNSDTYYTNSLDNIKLELMNKETPEDRDHRESKFMNVSDFIKSIPIEERSYIYDKYNILSLKYKRLFM